MTWRTNDGRTYSERDRPSSAVRTTRVGMAPRAPETPQEPSEPIPAPIDPPRTAREYLADVLARLAAGELGAVGELAGALNAARKEHKP